MLPQKSCIPPKPDFDNLRRLGAWAPVAAIGCLLVLETFINFLGFRWPINLVPHLLVLLTISAGAYLFSNFIFSRLREKEEEILLQNRQLVTLETRFRALIEKSSDGIVLLSRDGTFLYASPSTTRILGYPVEELIGRDAFELLHPCDRGRVRALFDEMVGKPGGITTAEFRMRQKDGSWMWLEGVGSNLLADPSIQAIVGNFRTITERKHAEDALRKAHDELEIRVQNRTAELMKANEALQTELAQRRRTEETLRKLSRAVEQAADAIVIAGHDGAIEYVNPAFERLTGYTREEVMGQTPRMLKSGHHDRAFYEDLWTRILSGQTFRDVFVNRKKTGELYHADEIITPLSDSRGHITHFVSSARDITERIRMEGELRRSQEGLRTLAAHLESVREEERKRISREIHDELGQVLTGLKFDLSWLASRLPEDLPSLREKARVLVGLVDATIDSVGRIAEELRPTALDGLGLMAAIEGLAREFQARTGIPCHFASYVRDPGQDPYLATTMFRICQEALTNVARHANAGHVAITLNRRATGLLLTIEDDGKGVTPQQISDSKSLGLLGMRERARMHGGSVVITGLPGKGTTVTVSFPFTKPAHESRGTSS